MRRVHPAGFVIAVAGLTASSAAAEPDWVSIALTPHAAYQAVDASGAGTFPVSTSGPIRLRGVLLNDPANMLDPSPGAAGFLGGQWQVTIQATEPGDSGGTTLFMGQYVGKVMGNHPGGSYTNAQWSAELLRLNHDPATGRQFRAGDLVEVRARAPGLFFSGKTNINEQHSIDPAADFDVHLVEAGYGLPAPEVVELAALKDRSNQSLFAPDRLSGPERYQGTLVRLNGVRFADTSGWGPGAHLAAMDNGGRSIDVLLGRGAGFSIYGPPVGETGTGRIDIIGILDQEDTNGADGWRDGYRIWVMDYAGSAVVVPEPATCALLAAAGGFFTRRKRN